jgi:hypothetical protein
MDSRIDEKTVVPIGWVLGGFTIMVTIAVTGAFWVSAVNFRLSRIEDRLGIPGYQTETGSSFDASAWAGPSKESKHVDTK